MKLPRSLVSCPEKLRGISGLILDPRDLILLDVWQQPQVSLNCDVGGAGHSLNARRHIWNRK
jgi:hypothetical protein